MVACLTRDSIWIQQVFFFFFFFQNEEFRDWILEKLIQAEQACHRVPSFARLHVRICEKEKENLILMTGSSDAFSFLLKLFLRSQSVRLPGI